MVELQVQEHWRQNHTYSFFKFRKKNTEEKNEKCSNASNGPKMHHI